MNPNLYKDLTNLRHELHKHPELSGQEYKTQKRLKDFLRPCNPDHLWEVGGTGLLVCFDSRREGPHILIRADMDALPITEKNQDMPYRSTSSGVAHKCGHDGHSTMVCGVARRLSEKPIAKGKVFLLFQPAEETGQGAKAVLADPIFKDQHFDYAFALHNLPGYPTHSIVMRDGSFTASVKSLSAHLDGATAHAAEPESGISPALAIAQIIQQFEEWQQPDYRQDNFQLITPIQVLMGEKAYGTAAGHGIVRYTLRAWHASRIQKTQQRIEQLLPEVAEQHGLELHWEWLEEFYSSKNESEAVKAICDVVESLKFQMIWREQPFKWGEDFGLFTQYFSGAMFGLGIGSDAPALHRPDYDFLDEVIPTGVAVFEGVARRWCGEKK